MTRRALTFLLFLAGVLFFLPSCQKYDELVEKDQTAQMKWADYEATLQRRADLIPNLVAVVKGAADYEKSTLQQVTEARAAATQVKLSADDLTDPAKVKAFQDAQNTLGGSLSRLLVANENYPQLKASDQYRDLAKQIEGSENRILRAREEYNAAVKDYNSELGKIKGSVVNKATGQPFKPRVYFTASADVHVAPKVSF
ncbi:MAG: LemA family protein [Labilithrix sp.]|nr:LemA family protein [Labilithrix sp.]MCW5812747.1 LemA family protein [Labilithrix sp.]